MAKQIKKVVILTAGLGTRFYPATKALSKEMLPIVDKPVIQYLVEEAVASGIKEVLFVVGRHRKAVEDHFEHIEDLDHELRTRGKKDLAEEVKKISSMAKFSYVEAEPNGPGAALLEAKNFVGDDPVAVLYGDDIVDAEVPCLKQLMNVYDEYNASVLALMRVPKKEVHQYGIVSGKRIRSRTWKLDGIIEKPSVEEAPSTLMSVGKYIYTPELFGQLSNMTPGVGGELWPPDVIDSFMRHGGEVFGYEFEGTRYDCGDKLGFMKAAIAHGMKHLEIGHALRQHLKKSLK